MNKKGITLIALVITVIILLILAIVSIAAITRGNIIDRTKAVKKDEQIIQIKETIRAVTNKVAGSANFSDTYDLVENIVEELNKIEGFESAEIYYDDDYDDFGIYVLDVGITFVEATGRSLERYIDSYVTRDDIEYRMN